MPADRNYLVFQINKAAKELHESKDLVNCNREQLFSLSPETQQVSLPHYVFQVRGIRNHYTRRQITFHDMRPRYQSSGWTEHLLAWRDKYRSPLMQEIDTFSPLIFSIPGPEQAPFTVGISGSTKDAQRVTETLTFPIGTTSQTTTNSYQTVDAITNTIQHTYDVSVIDINNRVLAVLPNSEFTSDYRVIQVLDFISVAPSSPYMIEVLYKIRFQPMTNDYDQFVCPGYDDAIVWKTLSYLYSRKDQDKMMAADAKCTAILRQIADDNEQSVEKLVEFRQNESLYLFHRFPRRYPRSLFPGAYPW